MDAIEIAIATQSTNQVSNLEKNCNCQISIATAIKLLRALPETTRPLGKLGENTRPTFRGKAHLSLVPSSPRACEWMLGGDGCGKMPPT